MSGIFDLGMFGLLCITLVILPLVCDKYWKRIKIKYDPTVIKDW